MALVNCGFFYLLYVTYPLTVIVTWGVLLSSAVLISLSWLLPHIACDTYKDSLWNLAICINFVLLPLILFGLSGFRLLMVPPVIMGFFLTSYSVYWPISLVTMIIGLSTSLGVAWFWSIQVLDQETLGQGILNMGSICWGLGIIASAVYGRQHDLLQSITKELISLEAQIKLCSKQLILLKKEHQRRHRWRRGVVLPHRPYSSQWLLEKKHTLLPEEHEMVMHHIYHNASKISSAVKQAFDCPWRNPASLICCGEFSLGKVVTNAINKLRDKYPQNPVNINIYQNVRIKGQPVLLIRLVNHLIQNSRLYSQSVLTEIDVFRSPSYAYLVLSDRGCPLSHQTTATSWTLDANNTEMDTPLQHRRIGLIAIYQLVTALQGRFVISSKIGEISFICRFPRLESKKKTSFEPPSVTFSTQLPHFSNSPIQHENAL